MQSQLEFKGYALVDPKNFTDLKVQSFKPKPFEDDDVEIAITHCGVCGSDVHTLKQGWGESKLPLVVGHEIVGKAVRVGKNVQEFKVGDRVGVGAQIWSCMQCRQCKDGYENYCPKQVDTYNAEYPDGTVAQGGYATAIRAHQQFVFPIPDAIDSKDAASMLCGGLTVFSPLVTNGAGPGKKVGIIGIGGLGHYAVLFAKALGAEVYAFTHTKDKMQDANELGADHVINTNDKMRLHVSCAMFLTPSLVGLRQASEGPARPHCNYHGCDARAAPQGVPQHALRPRPHRRRRHSRHGQAPPAVARVRPRPQRRIHRRLARRVKERMPSDAQARGREGNQAVDPGDADEGCEEGDRGRR